jgi:hypothetical protein
MSEIANLINESIDKAISINEVGKLEIMKGWYGNKLYDKMHPDENKPDVKFEAVKKLSKKLAEERTAHAATKKESDSQHSIEHAVDNTKKMYKGAVASAKKAVEDVKAGGIAKAAKDTAEKVKEKVGEASDAAVEAKDKAVGGIRKFAKEIGSGERNLANIPGNIDAAIKEHPYLSAAAAAALAAGAGGLAAVKRMRKVGKK